jgi:hypothetical protein
VLGFCVPDAVGPVSMVTELGDPLDTLRLLQFSWEDRLRVSTARLVVRRKVHEMYCLVANVYKGALVEGNFFLIVKENVFCTYCLSLSLSHTHTRVCVHTCKID